MSELCNCQRIKHRSEEEYKNLINRLNRIEGQIRGIKKMVASSAAVMSLSSFCVSPML